MRTGILQTYSAGFNLLARILDIAAVLLGGLSGSMFRFRGWDPPSLAYGEVLLLAAVLAVLIFPHLGVYRSWRGQNLLAPIVRALLAWSLVFVTTLLLLVMLKGDGALSRLWMVYWFVLTGLLLALARWAIYALLHWVRRWGFNHRQVLIIGCGKQAGDLLRHTRDAAWAGFDVAAVFDPGDGPCDLLDRPVRPLDTLAEFVHGHRIDEIWISLSIAQTPKLHTILEYLRNCPANVRYVPDMLGLFLLNHGISELLETPMIDLSTTPMQGYNRLVKGFEDRVLATIILLLISPLMGLIAIGVKLSSSGPVLFRQYRHGWGGCRIEVWKFRTMYVHREAGGKVTQAHHHDPRITPLGRFLRRTSLDELPQFINVLQGSMSIVGPRPHAIEHNEIYQQIIAHYTMRHRVKPGITGWAQINGWRGETDTVDKMRKRVQHDLYYIENWSLGFDLRIIFLTLIRGFVDKNAY